MQVSPAVGWRRDRSQPTQQKPSQEIVFQVVAHPQSNSSAFVAGSPLLLAWLGVRGTWLAWNVGSWLRATPDFQSSALKWSRGVQSERPSKHCHVRPEGLVAIRCQTLTGRSWLQRAPASNRRSAAVTRRLFSQHKGFASTRCPAFQPASTRCLTSNANAVVTTARLLTNIFWSWLKPKATPMESSQWIRASRPASGTFTSLARRLPPVRAGFHHYRSGGAVNVEAKAGQSPLP